MLTGIERKILEEGQAKIARKRWERDHFSDGSPVTLAEEFAPQTRWHCVACDVEFSGVMKLCDNPRYEYYPVCPSCRRNAHVVEHCSFGVIYEDEYE